MEVEDAAAVVLAVKAEQNLLRDLADQGHRDVPVLVTLDEAEEILAEDFEDHAAVDAVRAVVPEVVEEGMSCERPRCMCAGDVGASGADKGEV